MNYKSLLEKTKRFIKDSGVATTVFCRKCKMHPSTYYAWRRGASRISLKLAQRINSYLRLFGYDTDYT